MFFALIAMQVLSPLAVAIAMTALVASGCYDGNLLVEDARSAAHKHNTRLAEIDLGHFLTTLPRDQENSSFTDLEVHLFATVPRSRVSTAKKLLAVDSYRLRHDLLAAIRGATPQELAEPSLTELRKRVEEVVDEILVDQHVKSIGFYQVTMRRR
jgi:hypothetical protein